MKKIIWISYDMSGTGLEGLKEIWLKGSKSTCEDLFLIFIKFLLFLEFSFACTLGSFKSFETSYKDINKYSITGLKRFIIIPFDRYMYKRIGNYKDPGSPGFYYVDMVTNKKITDNGIIARIKNMKIPPNYNGVVINDKNGKILAYGYDSKKRKQVIYNPLFVNKRTVEKYNKISSLNNKNIFKKILKDITKNIKESGDAKLKEISIIIYLIVNCGFRIGNKKYRDENNSFGISTIKFKHIKFNTDHIVINFIGKKGVENKSQCSNRFICKYLKNKKHSGGASDQNVFGDIDSKDVNKYLQQYHDGLTSKDLRTWNANYLFLEYYKKYKKVGVKNPVKKAIEDVAFKLHNSYSICKKNYIDPNIVEKIKNDI